MRSAFLFVVILMMSMSAAAMPQILHHVDEQFVLKSPLWADAGAEAKDGSDGDSESENLITPTRKKKVKSFWKKYFAFKMNKNLSKDVSENKWAFFAGGCMSCIAGPVWLPMLVIDRDAPPDYVEEGFINWGSHFVFEMAMLGATVVIAAIGIPSPTLFLTCADMVWWLPVNAINVWDDGRKNALAQQRLQDASLASLVALDEDKPPLQMVY